jgi:hypothetical protein
MILRPPAHPSLLLCVALLLSPTDPRSCDRGSVMALRRGEERLLLVPSCPTYRPVRYVGTRYCPTQMCCTRRRVRPIGCPSRCGARLSKPS